MLGAGDLLFMTRILPYHQFNLCLLLLVTVLAGCGALEPVERRQVFHPVKYPDGDWKPRGLAVEDAWFTSADGTKLHGWYVPCEQPRAYVLYAHGNAGNLSHRGRILRSLKERHRVSVMIFDYRGYGRSEGEPTERGILQDARAARKWLARRAGIAESDIILMGRSLGGGVAVDLAAKDGAAGLVLQNTFTSLPDVANALMPYLPAKWLMSYRLDSLSKIKDYKGPLLQSHGDADRLIPIDQGRKLHDAAPGPKQFITVAGGGHNSPANAEFHRAFDALIERVARDSSTLQTSGIRFEPQP